MGQDMSPGSRTAIQAAHHQIGNSLQSVASLLRLEARTAPPEAAGLLKEASRRVGVVMRLHQRLQEGEGDSVHLDDLMGDVCRDVAALDALDRLACVELQADVCVAPSRIASSLATITAELVGNALEHGLQDRAGRVEVDLTRTPSGYRLVVEDDGVGLPVGGGDGFGLSLVRMLVGQMGGRIVFNSAPGGLRVEVVIERGPT